MVKHLLTTNFEECIQGEREQEDWCKIGGDRWPAYRLTKTPGFVDDVHGATRVTYRQPLGSVPLVLRTKVFHPLTTILWTRGWIPATGVALDATLRSVMQTQRFSLFPRRYGT